MKIIPFYLTKLLGQELSNNDEPSVLNWLRSIDQEVLKKYVIDFPIAENMAIRDDGDKKEISIDLLSEEFLECQHDLILSALYLNNLREGKIEEIDLEKVDISYDSMKATEIGEKAVRVILRVEYEQRDFNARRSHIERLLSSPSLSDAEKNKVNGVLKLMEEGLYKFLEKQDFHTLYMSPFFCDLLREYYQNPFTRDSTMDILYEVLKKNKASSV